MQREQSTSVYTTLHPTYIRTKPVSLRVQPLSEHDEHGGMSTMQLALRQHRLLDNACAAQHVRLINMAHRRHSH
jgi:hypothetical protein